MADQYLTTNLASYHFDREKAKHLNEVNPGIGYELKDGNLRSLAGIYKNSYDKNSLYGLLGYTPLQYGGLSAGVFGGLVSGYEKPITPAGGLLISYEKGKGGVNLSLIPPSSSNGQKTSGFAGLQYKYKMD